MTFQGADAIATITLERPEKKNALDPETLRQLRAAFDSAARDDAVRVIVLKGKGTDFCAGADLDALAALVDGDEEAHRADARGFSQLFTCMRDLPKPIIAAVRGRALAGGAGLVLASDIVIAAEDVQLGFPEVKIGFIAGVVLSLLRRATGEKAAFELVATGRQVAAAEALRIGLVTRVVPAAELDAAVNDTARALAELAPDALARTKRLFYEIDLLPFNDALGRGVEANVAARSTSSFRDGLATFLAAKGKPRRQSE